MSQFKTCSGRMFIRQCYFGSRFLRKSVYFYYNKLGIAVLRKSMAKNSTKRTRKTVESDY